MRKARIGVVCLTRKTYDYETAFAIYKERMEKLAKDESVDWKIHLENVIEPEDAEKAIHYLNAEEVDAVVIVSGTFHLGHLALMIRDAIRKPILLWGFDELPYNGVKIRLNAVCGVNLNASNLYKAGVDDYTVTIGDDIDWDWVKAIKAIVAMKTTRIGLVGYRAQGFYNVGVDDLAVYRNLGILINHYELSDLFNNEVDEKKLKEEIAFIHKEFSTKELNERQVELVARLVASTEVFLKKKGVDALAIRCWPEFAANYGVAPCAMMSILQSRGVLLACEGDIEALISMIAVKAFGEPTPFMADLSQVNFKENYALLWHCGVAPCNLWDKKCDRSLDTYFAGGRGVTAGFVLQTGDFSIFRIDTARGKTRLFYEEGTAIPMEKLLTGTFAKVKFAHDVKDVLDKVVYTGVAHHVIMGYVRYEKALRMLSRIMGWEIIEC